MPHVSVDVVTHNNADTVVACLQSVLKQQYTDYNLTVIDNASTDDTVARIESLGIAVIARTENVGYSAAHNQAIDNTDSAYLLTLNPDVWLDPQYLTAMVRALEGEPHLGSAAGCILRVEQLGQTPTHIDSTGLTMSRTRRQRLRDEGRPVARRPVEIAPIFGPDGSAAFYRRAMLNDIRVNGEVFDGDFFVHKEDIDVCWRARLRGWGAIYVPDAIAHHIRRFRPGKRERVPPLLRCYSVRNRYLLMLKNEIPGHFLRDLWAIVPYDLGMFIYMLMKERPSLAAFPSMWALRKQMLAKRRIIQSRRRLERTGMQQWFC